MCDLLVGLRVDVRRDERDAGALVRAELPEDDAESIDLGLGAIFSKVAAWVVHIVHTSIHMHMHMLSF